MNKADKKSFIEIAEAHIEFVEDSNKMLAEDNIELFRVIIDINSEYKEQLKMLIDN